MSWRRPWPLALSHRGARWLALLCLLGAAAPGPSILRAGDKTTDGLFITVPNPITENAVLQIEQRVRSAVERQGRVLDVVVFDFNPQGKPSGTGNVFPCMQLKDYISRLSTGQVPKCPRVLTVGYVQDEVTDHTVLPLLACREIVMSSKGQFGYVQRGQDQQLSKEAQHAYEETARAWPATGLLAKITDSSKTQALIDVELARKLGLCRSRLESRIDVKDQYNLPTLSLREDLLQGRTPIVWRIEVHGALDGGKLNSLERRIRTAIRKKANVIILHLDCDGGETVDAAAMADKLRNLTDDGGLLPVQTIAYVPPRVSLGAATFLALGCSEIAMAPDGQLGGFEYLRSLGPQTLAVKERMLVELARTQGYQPAFFEAMLRPGATIYLCRNKDKPGVAVLTDAQRVQQPDWVPESVLFASEKGELFNLSASMAKRFGIAHYAEVTSPEALYDRYGFDPSKVESSRDDWLDAVAFFLREPLVNVILIMLGVAGLVLELKMPGFGVPGIVSAICFVLFFWSHAFAGQSTWEFTLLAFLLFVLGVFLLILEIFVLPGFGVTGISGVLLIVCSLVLVMLERMPSTSQEWGNLGTALATVGIGLAAGLASALTVARYLPSIPYAGKMVLQPPTDEDEGGSEREHDASEAASLLGAIGVAATTLRPAGKAQFGDDFLDVIAEGDYVNPGSRVQVIEIEGNRIVVKEI
jgi:membrane-bound serine protease (ClpP class)